MATSEGDNRDMFIIGIDVGGTNTDAALISGDTILATAKVPTCHNKLVESTTSAFESLMDSYDGPALSGRVELRLSTTLSTNAIIEGQGDPTVVLATPGPGMNIARLGLGFPIYTLSGYMDHRGREVAPINPDEVLDAVGQAARSGASALAVVGKFSHRNPTHELEIEKLILGEASVDGHCHEACSRFADITLGHRLSGRPNFPRRIATSYLNASIGRRQAAFADMVRKFMIRGKNVGNVFLLKADGGTMRLEDSLVRPVETILSGPAASIMGARALSAYPDLNTAIVDIGGTTTDVSVQVRGEPVFQQQGAEISGHKTLVPALFSRSVGLGGDSEIRVILHPRTSSERTKGADAASHENDGRHIELQIGPGRAGTPSAFGGDCVTPTDAAVALGLARVGSRRQAMKALADFGQPYGMKPEEMAKEIVDTFTRKLVSAVNETYRHLESQPVYTVSEMLAPPDIRPKALIGLGAPAGVFIPPAARCLGLEHQVLPHYESANAIGAAASRPTASITLHADTALGVMTVPEADYVGRIERPVLFDIKQARNEAMEWAARYSEKLGLRGTRDIQIVEEESFNMVRGFHTVGRVFMIRAQVRPGVRRIRAR